jgi:conjugal transfer pilus assembly protein TraU
MLNLSVVKGFAKKIASTILFVTILFFSFTPKSEAMIGCTANPSSMLQIFTESIATLYNIFPITVAGVPININNLPTADELGGLPVCICMQGSPPIPRIGLTFGWWNPEAVIETVKAPFCFPTLGFGFGTLGGQFFGEGSSGEQIGAGSKPSAVGSEKQVYTNVHWVKYPVFALLDLFTDVACLNLTEGGIDFLYLSEVDPTWRNDQIASIINPESILFANPIAQIACIPDSITSTAGFPLDPLFWCMGSWGSSYPLAGNAGGEQIMGNAALAARTIYRMGRMLLLWQTIGKAALCQPIPMPIWIKSMFSIYEGYPMLWPLRMPIGRTEMIWGAGMNPPVPTRADNFVWFVYQHHECCIF